MKAPDTSARFFDSMFRHSSDPWNFAADSYEQHRYQAVLRALQPGRYRRAFEPGCSVGVLTAQLATICDRVDACDFAPAAVEQARERCKHLPGVSVQCASLTDAASYDTYDLIVLSEIGYYFSAAAWQCLLSDMAQGMQPGATMLASHWLGYSPDHVLSGDEVHGLTNHPALQHRHAERHDDPHRGGFRLDLWRKLP